MKINSLCYALVILLITMDISQGCIWQSKNLSGETPFWESKTIEVCFAPPNPQPLSNAENLLDDEYRAQFNENIQIVKATFERQINNRTSFKMQGFNLCSSDDDSKDMIRINMNDSQGAGAMASSIGPRSRQESENVTMSSTDEAWPGGIKPSFTNGEELPNRVRTFNTRRVVSWVALHETMHLLGLHHSEYWDEDMSGADIDVEEVIQFGLLQDSDSVMTRGQVNTDSIGLAVLSETDVSCLNHIADQTIDDFPSRTAAIVSQCSGLDCESNDFSSGDPLVSINSNRQGGKDVPVTGFSNFPETNGNSRGISK
jgi:hypothetical protein